MKTLNKIFFCLVILTANLFTQDEETPPYTGEIKVINQSTTRTIYVRVFPVSMIFNGNNFYDLHTLFPDVTGNYQYRYMTGASLYNDTISFDHRISPGHFIEFQHELAAQTSTESNGILGFGVYKFEFYWDGGLRDTCLVEYDAEGAPVRDLSFFFKQDTLGTNPRVEYNWAGIDCTERTIQAAGRYLKRWEPDWCHNPPIHNRSKNPGNFQYITDPNNAYQVLPQDLRQNCGEENYPWPALLDIHYGTGLLNYNLTIDKNIRTRVFLLDEYRYGAPEQIVISQECTLTLNNSRTFRIEYDIAFDEGLPDFYNKFYVKSDAVLKLNPNSNLIFEKTNWLILECDSKVIMGQGSSVLMESGSKFCMSGGNVQGGNITIQGYIQRLQCMIPCNEDNIFEDSAKLIIDTNSVLELPDSTFITFKGNESQLICKENSTIKFGKGSKLIFEDGARISANGCKFVSYDTTQTWDGIYLSDDANDTIKNCVIQNAYNGINISEPSSISLTNYTTEITNCTFKNSTSTQLLNQVYIDGANGVLVKGCSTVSGVSSGFASCIVMQYCPSGSVVITDNNFSNCDIGITAIQSSPYIARNTITGLTGTGTGLYLDNSNGTIEYNIVNNFEKSVECGYSSPYLLKNTFNDASDMIVQLYSASVPVMRPVNSGTVTRWLGGNNTLSGMPTTGAFVLEKESYPMMDSGYNKILTNGYNYVYGELDGDLEAGMNHWQDNPPNTAYYAVSGGEVIYDPVFNGTSLPTMDYYDLNSIGFGMYDSVFVIDNGDNPLAGSLFMQAYSNEMSGNYSTAITKYKDVVTEYKTSTYATVSLARIFNCLEKSNGSVSDYSNIQSYYASIESDTNNTKESREISEDFVIKSKVRQGNILEAVSDYETIYQNNQNTHKGTHALLNKLCLLKYGAGGDNPNSSISTESKIDILSLISGKSLSQNISSNTNITPKTFKLHQNYPNPFNPTTNIKYEIPRDANVSIKIYDLLGREVFNVNEYKTAGSYEVLFDGSNLASGLYFYSIKAETSQRDVFTETKKMVLIK